MKTTGNPTQAKPKTLPGPLGSAKLHTILLFVKDFDAMLAFYRDTLGLQVGYQNSGFANLHGAGGAAIALHAGRKGGPTRERHSITEFIVEDIEATTRALASRGVSVSPIRKEPFGQIAEFKDPEGNVIGLEQPPQH